MAYRKEDRLKVIRDHIKQESTQDIEGLLNGMSKDCFTLVACSPKPYVGKKAVERRYREQWTGFPDFKVRIRKVVSVTEKFSVTENEWSGDTPGRVHGHPAHEEARQSTNGRHLGVQRESASGRNHLL